MKKILSSKSFKLSFIFALTLLFSACSISTTTDGMQSGSSVFYSGDRGNTWRDASGLATVSASLEKISNLDIHGIYADPSDSAAMYLATAKGLYYTYSITDGWNLAKSLPQDLIRSVAVNQNNKCMVYVAMGNRVLRSVDCSRSFQEVYVDNDKAVMVNSVLIDHYNPRNIYIATSRGEVIKSIDEGQSWRTIHRFEEPIAKIISSPKDSRLIFVATNSANLFSFFSNTETNPSTSADVERNFQVSNFKDLNAVLRDLSAGNVFKDVVVSPSDGAIFLATDKQIFRSKNDGLSWEPLNLIQPDGQVAVNTMTVSPRNSNEIYYATNSTFFRSSDGGVSWTTKKLPSARGGSALLVDFDNTNNIYLGTYRYSSK